MFFLQTNGSGVLSFAGVSASAGQVIQVITATDSTGRSTSSTSFATASNTLSVSITPSSASNKIFVICTCSFGKTSEAGSASGTIFRGATNLGTSTGMMSNFSDGGATIRIGGSMSILDSPNTTSATTYQAYFKTTSETVDINWNNTKSSITCFEIKG